MFYNVLKRSAWNRLFFNEKEYLTTADFMKEQAELMGVRKLNLRDAEDREEFRKELKRVNKEYPGFVAPDGEEVDEEMYIQAWLEANPENQLWSSDFANLDTRSEIGRAYN